MAAEEESLEAMASSLFEKRGELNGEANRWKDERDRLNEAVKGLHAQAKAEREERDRVNREVAELKERLQGLRRKLEAKRGRVEDIDVELEESRRGLRPRQRVEEDLFQVEWELTTTPTLEVRERESELVERAGRLRRELEEHDRLDARDDAYLISLADSKAVEMEIRDIRSQMRELHEESQKHHERMLGLYRKADEERKRADEAHERFLGVLASIREVNVELDEVMGELGEHRKIQREAERRHALLRERSLEEKKKELVAEARRKLEAGEKLTLEEMKLIYGEE